MTYNCVVLPLFNYYFVLYGPTDKRIDQLSKLQNTVKNYLMPSKGFIIYSVKGNELVMFSGFCKVLCSSSVV